MAFTHTLTIGTTRVGGDSVFSSVNGTSGKDIGIDESFSNGAADVAVAFSFVRAKLQSFYMVSDQALTVEVNSSSSPAQTFTLAANRPLIWYPDCGISVNLYFAADITSIFVSNSSGATATLQIRALVDPT